MLHHIIYASHAEKPLTEEELVLLLEQARYANLQKGITGLLVYGANQFIQVMEGEMVLLRSLYKRIAQDARHYRLIKMADKAITERSFADWSMAFQVFPPEQFAHLAGYVAPEDVKLKVGSLSAADALLLEIVKQLALPVASAQ